MGCYIESKHLSFSQEVPYFTLTDPGMNDFTRNLEAIWGLTHRALSSTTHGFSTCELKVLNCVTMKFPLNLHFYQQLNCVTGIRDIYKRVSYPPSSEHVKAEFHFSL